MATARHSKFPLGRTVITRNALSNLTHADVVEAFGRHQKGDWGDLDAEDRQANERALVAGERLFSVYRSVAGVRFYVITERDCSVTTVLLPEDY